MSKQRNIDDLISQAKNIHDDKYDYSKVIYTNNKTKVCIICPNHGEFWQLMGCHVTRQQGCPTCCYNERGLKKRLSFDEFVGKANNIHNFKYDYSKVTYINNKIKVCIICPIHGEFWCTPSNHLGGRACSCCKASKGEMVVKQCLEQYNINHISEYYFDDCRDINSLRFDFYLPYHNILIEYDGIQHSESIEFFGGDKGLKETQKHDAIKNQYCEDNNIKLIRIPYYDFDKINEIMTTQIK